MKLNNTTKALAFSLLLPLLSTITANAQSAEDAVKKKRDSVQNAAVNDPVGTVSKVMSLFSKKKAAPAAAPAANLVAASAPAAAPVVAAPVAPVLLSGHSKTINNGLIFTITQCTGDRAAQTITVVYKIANPNKANQLVVVGALSQYSSAAPGFSIDDNGSKLTISKVDFGGQSAAHITTELPTGISMKGSITLINALPSSTSLQYLKLPIASQNAKGGADKQTIQLEDRDIPVTWTN